MGVLSFKTGFQTIAILWMQIQLPGQTMSSLPEEKGLACRATIFRPGTQAAGEDPSRGKGTLRGWVHPQARFHAGNRQVVLL